MSASLTPLAADLSAALHLATGMAPAAAADLVRRVCAEATRTERERASGICEAEATRARASERLEVADAAEHCAAAIRRGDAP